MSAAPGVLLVGSIPLDTSEAVFEMFGRPLGALDCGHLGDTLQSTSGNSHGRSIRGTRL